MQKVLERLPSGARIAVIRLRSLGDCVLSTPALHLLKLHRPDLSIAVVVEDAFAPIFAGNPDLDAILPPSPLGLARWHPALCLNLHGGMRSAQLTLASRARFRAGFAHFRWRPLYNVQILTAQRILEISRTVHTAEHAACAVFHLGVPPAPIPRARLYVGAPGPAQPERPYAVIHPFASAPDKTWPAPRFAALARFFEENSIFSPSSSPHRVRVWMPFPATNRCPAPRSKRSNVCSPAQLSSPATIAARLTWPPRSESLWPYCSGHPTRRSGLLGGQRAPCSPARPATSAPFRLMP